MCARLRMGSIGVISTFLLLVGCSADPPEDAPGVASVEAAAEMVAAAADPAMAGMSPDEIRERASEAYDEAREKATEEYNAIRENTTEEYNSIRDKATEEYNAARDKAREAGGGPQEKMAATAKAMEVRTKAMAAAMEVRTKAMAAAMEARIKANAAAMEARRAGAAAVAAAPAGADEAVAVAGADGPGADTPQPGVTYDLGAATVPPIAELANKSCTCTVSGAPKLSYSDGKAEALGLADASAFVLEVTCAGAGNRSVHVYASSSSSLELFDVGDGTALAGTAKGTSDSPVSFVLSSVTGDAKPWMPELPPAPDGAPGYAEAEAEYQAAVKALAAEYGKKYAELAKAQAAAVALAPKTHAKELAEMNKEHKESKKMGQQEINDAIKEQNVEIREELAECKYESGEDARDCRADVNETKRDYAEENKEARVELAESNKEADAEHRDMVKEHKGTLPDMLQEARVEGSKAIIVVKAEQKKKIAELAQVRDGKVGGEAARFSLVAETIKGLCAKRGEPVPQAVAGAAASASAAGGVADAYPAECAGLDMAVHVEIKGDAGWCVSKDPGRMLLMGAKEFEGPGEGYDDEGEFSVLGSPDKRLEEFTEISGAEKSAKQKETRARIYYTELEGSCNGELTETSGNLTMSCDLTDASFYTASPPVVKRTQECESVGGDRCTDSCTDHDDCDGWLCGCPESRCVWFRCTGCPSERVCEEPEFDLTIAPYKASRAFKGADRDLAREIAVDDSDHRPVVGFKVASVWRKIFMGKECDEDYDGRRVCESILEHTSGYRTKITPVFSGYVHCPGGSCSAAKQPSLAVKTGSFSVNLENSGHSAKVTCSAKCSAVKVD